MPTALEILSFAEKYSFYFIITIFIIGGFGNLVNISVLTSLKLFRSNQCAFYLIMESIINTCQLFILFIIYLLPIITGSDPGNTSIVWCKLKNMIPQTFRLISTSMVCFAAFDQFLSTNPRPLIRQMSTLQLAHYLTFVAICIWSIHSIPYGIFYEINPSNGCILNSVRLTEYYSYFYYPILHGLLPIFVSILFSLLAFRNARRLIRRQTHVIRRKRDRQLTAMVFARVILFVLFLLPYTIYRIYALNITVSRANNLYPYAVDQLIYSIITSVSNLNYIVRFLFLFSIKSYENNHFR